MALCVLSCSEEITPLNNIRPSISSSGLFVTYEEERSDEIMSAINGQSSKNSIQIKSLINGDFQNVEVIESAQNARVSGNGTHVVYLEDSSIYVKDLITGETALASSNSKNQGANSYAINPSISDDGRYVVFESKATNLIPLASSDTVPSEKTRSVFIKDMTTGNMKSFPCLGGCDDGPKISGNGRFVAYVSIGPDINNRRLLFDISVFDMESGTAQLVSRLPDGSSLNNAPNLSPSISYDGRYIAFLSYRYGICVKDMKTGNINIVSSEVEGRQSNSTDSDTDLLDSNLGAPFISSDGRYVAFTSNASSVPNNNSNKIFNVLVKDISSGEVKIASTDASGTPGNATSYEPSISADGRFVVFYSESNNLTGDIISTCLARDDIFEKKTCGNVYLKDLATGSIKLISNREN